MRFNKKSKFSWFSNGLYAAGLVALTWKVGEEAGWFYGTLVAVYVAVGALSVWEECLRRENNRRIEQRMEDELLAEFQLWFDSTPYEERQKNVPEKFLGFYDPEGIGWRKKGGN